MVPPCQYADVLGDDDPTGGGLGPRTMISSVVPRIYERLWRPLFAPADGGPLPAGVADAVIRTATGTRVFGRDALTGALAGRGLTAIDQHVAGLAQFVSARRD
jgi:hypothetical protein